MVGTTGGESRPMMMINVYRSI